LFDDPVYTNILTNDKWHADLVSIRLITTSWQVYVIAQACQVSEGNYKS